MIQSINSRAFINPTIIFRWSYFKVIYGRSLSRRTLGRRIEHRYNDLKAHIKTLLSSISYVAVTADLWSAHHKGFLGTTVSWIDPTSRERQSAMLGCARVKGRHTSEVIAGVFIQYCRPFKSINTENIEKKLYLLEEGCI